MCYLFKKPLRHSFMTFISMPDIGNCISKGNDCCHALIYTLKYRISRSNSQVYQSIIFSLHSNSTSLALYGVNLLF